MMSVKNPKKSYELVAIFSSPLLPEVMPSTASTTSPNAQSGKLFSMEAHLIIEGSTMVESYRILREFGNAVDGQFRELRLSIDSSSRRNIVFECNRVLIPGGAGGNRLI
jgi:hypothetical protein